MEGIGCDFRPWVLFYLGFLVKRVENIIRHASHQIDEEPGAQVGAAYDFGVGHDRARWSDKGRVEVEDDVNEKHYVHDGVRGQGGNTVAGLPLERHVVRHHDGGVEGEEEDHPVPRGLEGRVVEDNVGRGLGALLPVLRQRHHIHGGLQTRGRLLREGEGERLISNSGKLQRGWVLTVATGRPFSTVDGVEALGKPLKADRVFVTDRAILANLLKPPERKQYLNDF